MFFINGKIIKFYANHYLHKQNWLILYYKQQVAANSKYYAV